MTNENLLHIQYLKISNVDVKGTVLSNGTTYNTDGIKTTKSKGYASILSLVSGSPANLAISLQVSLDGQTFYDPYSTDGSSLTSKAAIVSGQAANRWIDIDNLIQLAPWIRFVLTPSNDTTATILFMHQE